MSAPGLRHGFDDSEGKSRSKSVDRIGLPVTGCTGLPFGSSFDVCRAGKSVPSRLSAVGGCEPDLAAEVSVFSWGVEEEALRMFSEAEDRPGGRLACEPEPEPTVSIEGFVSSLASMMKLMSSWNLWWVSQSVGRTGRVFLGCIVSPASAYIVVIVVFLDFFALLFAVFSVFHFDFAVLSRTVDLVIVRVDIVFVGVHHFGNAAVEGSWRKGGSVCVFEGYP